MYSFLHIKLDKRGQLSREDAAFCRGRLLVGVEARLPQALRTNLLPQGEGRARRTLIQVALDLKTLPREGAVLVTTAPRIEVLAAMAILWDRAKHSDWPFDQSTKARLSLLQQVSLWGHKDWQPTPVPTLEDRWPEADFINTWSHRTMALLRAMLQDEGLSFQGRVNVLWYWLRYGHEPGQKYDGLVDSARAELLVSLRKGTSMMEEIESIPVVESYSPDACFLAMTRGPVVVVSRRNAPWTGGVTGRRIAIKQYAPEYFAAKRIAAALNDLEPEGWQVHHNDVENSKPTKLDPQEIVAIMQANR